MNLIKMPMFYLYLYVVLYSAFFHFCFAFLRNCLITVRPLSRSLPLWGLCLCFVFVRYILYSIKFIYLNKKISKIAYCEMRSNKMVKWNAKFLYLFLYACCVLRVVCVCVCLRVCCFFLFIWIKCLCRMRNVN